MSQGAYPILYMLQSDLSMELASLRSDGLGPVPHRTSLESIHTELFDHRTIQACELTSIRDRVLAELYSTDRAYCHPDDVGQSVSGLRASLHQWFDRLPLDEKFTRDLRGQALLPIQDSSLVRRYMLHEFDSHD